MSFVSDSNVNVCPCKDTETATIYEYIKKDQAQQALIKKVDDLFNTNNIKHILLKGSRLKPLYKASYMRGMGELLIDFIPNEKGLKLSDVSGFSKYPGGAPANVCVAGKKSGVDSYFLGQVGKDSFGDFLKAELKSFHVHTTYLNQTDRANTALAFVSLTKDGERDFIFYRNPSADQPYNASQVPTLILKDAIFHFCSVSLCDYPVKNAHLKALKTVRKQNGFISFDPNLRLSLWSDLDAYKAVINEFIPYAYLLKVSSDELEFITGSSDIIAALPKLFVHKVKYVIITKGNKGADFYYKDGKKIHQPGLKVDVVDTTGAGDAFIGSFLAEMSKCDLDFSQKNVEQALLVSNKKAALTTTKPGGMSAIPMDIK